MSSTTRFLNIRTQNLVEIVGPVNTGTGFAVIATVRADGYGPKRRAKASSFYPRYLDRDGNPRTAGYVPVETLPDDHPHAVRTEIDDMDLIDHLDQLGEIELAELILRQQEIAQKAEALIEKAKNVAKSRRRTTGTVIFGDVAMVFAPGGKFNADYARTNLDPEDYRKICLPKPDPKLAKRLFANEPKKLALCQKNHGFTLTVREVTDKDREAVQVQEIVNGDVEVFDYPGF